MILNLTQHKPTPEQRAEGVTDPLPEVVELLTFREVPSRDDLMRRAVAIADIALSKFDQAGSESVYVAMLGGASYLMSMLERFLKVEGIKPIYSFTLRHVIEIPQADGSMSKHSRFKHIGWVEV